MNGIFKVMIAGVAAVMVLAGCGRNNVELVKNATLEKFSKNITVGQAFDNYSHFSSRTWEAFTGEKGEKVVVFKGIIKPTALMEAAGTKSGEIIVQFIVNKDGTFKINYLGSKITSNNGSVQEDNLTHAIVPCLSLIYNNHPF